MITYASELATRALRLEPIGAAYTGGDTSCTMCGRPIRRGDLFAKLKMPRSFMDYPALRGTGVLCGHCNTTKEQAVLRKLQRCVITVDGCYPIGSDANRAWLLLEPPEPPFAVVVNQANMTAAFHLHWRTQVTLDKNLLAVNVDNEAMYVRRPVMLEAIGWCRQLADAINEARPPAKRIADLSHPYASLSRDIFGNDAAAGNLSFFPEVRRLGGEHAKTLVKLEALWPGELWALATLAKRKPPTPEKPAPVTSIEKQDLEAEEGQTETDEATF